MSPTYKVEPVEVELSKMNIQSFFHPKFQELLKKELGDSSFFAFALRIPKPNEKEKYNVISFSHTNMEDYKNEIITISTPNPEILKKVLEIVEKFESK